MPRRHSGVRYLQDQPATLPSSATRISAPNLHAVHRLQGMPRPTPVRMPTLANQEQVLLNHASPFA